MELQRRPLCVDSDECLRPEHLGRGLTAPGVKSGQSNRQSRGNAPTRPRAGFTLLELLVVIAIIGILAALLLPALSRAKGAARSARCKSNLHQVALAFTMYLQENSDKYPAEQVPGSGIPGSNVKMGAWTLGLLPSLAQGGDVFFCPTRTGRSMTSGFGLSGQLRPNWLGVPYEYNTQGTAKRDARSRLGLAWSDLNVPSPAINEVHEAQVKAPSDMIALSEPSGAETQIALLGFVWVGAGTSASTNWTGAVHNGHGNGLFCDGHVESQKQARWQEPTDQVRRRWNIDNEPHRETW